MKRRLGYPPDCRASSSRGAEKTLLTSLRQRLDLMATYDGNSASAVWGLFWLRQAMVEYVGQLHFLAETTVTTMYQEIIGVEPGKRTGRPCIRGMRITVYDVLSYLAAGMSHPEILADFPELTEEDILACLGYAADREQHTLVAH